MIQLEWRGERREDRREEGSERRGKKRRREKTKGGGRRSGEREGEGGRVIPLSCNVLRKVRYCEGTISERILAI